jgi:hypothetical protein
MVFESGRSLRRLNYFRLHDSKLSRKRLSTIAEAVSLILDLILFGTITSTQNSEDTTLQNLETILQVTLGPIISDLADIF